MKIKQISVSVIYGGSSMEEPIVIELGLTATQAHMLNHVLSLWLHANKYSDIPQLHDNIKAIQQAVEGV